MLLRYAVFKVNLMLSCHSLISDPCNIGLILQSSTQAAERISALFKSSSLPSALSSLGSCTFHSRSFTSSPLLSIVIGLVVVELLALFWASDSLSLLLSLVCVMFSLSFSFLLLYCPATSPCKSSFIFSIALLFILALQIGFLNLG